MPGDVEEAVRETMKPGDVFTTVGRNTTAVVGVLDSARAVVLVGQKRSRSAIPWECLEGVPIFLVGRGWVKLAGGAAGEGGSLASYLESNGCDATPGLFAALLEHAGVVEVDRERPASVRLLDAMSPSRDRGGNRRHKGQSRASISVEERPYRGWH